MNKDALQKNVMFVLLFIYLINGCFVKASAQENQADNQTLSTEDSSSAQLNYEEFKALSNEEQISVFEELSSPEIYYLVKSSETENWPVTAYDLVTENNAKEFIILIIHNHYSSREELPGVNGNGSL